MHSTAIYKSNDGGGLVLARSGVLLTRKFSFSLSHQIDNFLRRMLRSQLLRELPSFYNDGVI